MRLAPLLLSLALVPATLTTTGASAAPDPAGDSATRQQRARVTLAADASWVRKGDVVTLRGKVRGTRGRTTVWIFQKKLRRGSSWNVEARKRTTRKGAFRHSEDILTGHRMYKACTRTRCSTTVTVRMGTPPPPPPPANQPTALGLSSISVASTEAGTPFTVTGTAVNLDGRAVQVQAYDAGSTSWGSIGSAVVAGGQWSASVAVTSAGRAVPVRAYFPGASGLGASASGESPVTVYGWYHLYDSYYDGLPQLVSSGFDEQSAAVNGVTYTKSLVGYVGGDDLGEYNLARSCTRFAAVAGLTDDSPTSSRVSMQVGADSVTKWSTTNIALGQAYPLVLDVTGALRLKLSAQLTSGSSAYEVFGDARVLCAF